jgi:hypothetical protein
MPVLVGVDIDGDGAVGARSLVALPTAAAGGWRYNLVNTSLLGSGSV